MSLMHLAFGVSELLFSLLCFSAFRASPTPHVFVAFSQGKIIPSNDSLQIISVFSHQSSLLTAHTNCFRTVGHRMFFSFLIFEISNIVFVPCFNTLCILVLQLSSPSADGDLNLHNFNKNCLHHVEMIYFLLI